MGGIKMYREGATYKDADTGGLYTFYSKRNGDSQRVNITPKTSGRILKNGDHTAKRPDGTTVKYRTNEGKVTGIYDEQGHLQPVLNSSGKNLSGQLDGRTLASSIQKGRTTYSAGHTNSAIFNPENVRRGLNAGKTLDEIRKEEKDSLKKMAAQIKKYGFTTVKEVETNEPKTTGGRKIS
jgi:hypothetical protein